MSGGEPQRRRFALALAAAPSSTSWTSPRPPRRGRPPRLLGRDAPTPPQGRTVVFATHYLEEADPFADRIVLMAAGRIVADGRRPRSSRWWPSVRSGGPCPTSSRPSSSDLLGVERNADRHGDPPPPPARARTRRTPVHMLLYDKLAQSPRRREVARENQPSRKAFSWLWATRYKRLPYSCLHSD